MMLNLSIRIPLSFIRAGIEPQRWSKSPFILFLFVLLALGDMFSQERTKSFRPSDTDKKTATFTVSANEVDLAFTVTDKHHHWITDLSEDELLLRDNGEPPESVLLFQSRKGLPLRLGLLLDVSDSLAPQFAFEKDAASLFIREMVDPAQDLAFVVGFNEEPILSQDFTADSEALASAVQRLHLSGSTAMYDAVDFGCRKMMEHDAEGTSRRVLVLLTDGQDNSSHLISDQLIENTIRCNVTVIVLHTDPEPDESTPHYKVLKKLASETGGQIFRAGNKKQMAKALVELSEQLRSYYLLAYQPAQFKTDGSYRKVELKTTRRGAHIICRRGYYARR